jgi:hypothetical protein
MDQHKNIKSFNCLGSRQKRRRFNENISEKNKSDTCDLDGYEDSNLSHEGSSIPFPRTVEFQGEATGSVDQVNIELQRREATGSVGEPNVELDSDEATDIELNMQESEPHENASVTSEWKLKIAITDWAVDEINVPADAITRLLKKVNKIFPSIPQDIRSLIEKPEPNSTIKIDHEAQYVHIKNWVASIRQHLELNWAVGDEKEFSLAINIDGLPLFKNSAHFHLYPILVRVQEYPSKIFTAGLYCSNKSSKQDMIHPDELLKLFADDIRKLSYEGLPTAVASFTFKIGGPFICDAPCRADLKQIVHHSGYYACERCKVRGNYKGHHVTFEEISAPERTKESFNAKDDKKHHVGSSTLLENLGIDMVNNFVIDYMHNVCLGVMKRLLQRWVKSPKANKSPQFGRDAVQHLTRNISQVSPHVSRDFNRRLEGGLRKLSYWKATEFRLFLLYVGPVVLKSINVISREKYTSFLKLSVAIRLLLTNSQENNLSFVESLLREFVNDCVKQYTTEFISYNVHNLIHLPSDYKRYKNLENISAFPFESYLGCLKACLRSGFKPLKQIEKYVTIKNMRNFNPASKNIECVGSVESDSNEELKMCLKKTKINGIVFKSCSVPSHDNCVILQDGAVAIITNIILTGKKNKLTIKKFSKKKDFFKYPVASSYIGIYYVAILSDNLTVSPEDIYCKCVLLPHKGKFVALKMLHI